jgi:hypothetical protein
MAAIQAYWENGQVVLEESVTWPEGCPLEISEKSLSAMQPPPNQELPFFAYGVFKPGQLAFFQLKDFVAEVSLPTMIRGTLLVRDGLPIIDKDGHGEVKGVIFRFAENQGSEAYRRIAALEPQKHYCWEEVRAGETDVNVLLGKSPRKGSDHCEDKEWDGKNDPLFTSALDVIDETLANNQEFDWDLKPLFRLQMAYLLLWSAIERYVSLRYHLGENAKKKVNQLPQEPAFSEALQKHVHEPRSVFRADRPDTKFVLDVQSPRKALDYYYQIRSNITHRGKGVFRDHEKILKSLDELVHVFRDVKDAAFDESQREGESRTAKVY